MKTIMMMLVLLLCFTLSAFAGDDIGQTIDAKVLILGALLAISEALSLVPAIKANGVAQFVFALLRWLGRK